jgi:hypothetical protein
MRFFALFSPLTWGLSFFVIYFFLIMFHIDNSLRWRLIAIDTDGRITFWNVYDSESRARSHARMNNDRSHLGRRWFAVNVRPGDELSSSFNINDYIDA